MKIYGDDDATVSLSIATVGARPDRLGVAVDAGAVVNQIVNEMKNFKGDISMIDIDYTGQIEEQNKNQERG